MSYAAWHRDDPEDHEEPLLSDRSDRPPDKPRDQAVPLLPEEVDFGIDDYLFLDTHPYSWWRPESTAKPLLPFCSRPLPVICGGLLVGCMITLFLTLAFHQIPSSDLGSPYLPTPSADYSLGAVVTDAVECSQIGNEMLRQRGSAVDVAIAAMLCLGVVNFHTSGIGGGFIMTSYDKDSNGSDKKVEILNALNSLPSAASPDFFNHYPPNQTENAGLYIGVPGAIHGYWTAHQRYGRLQWQRLFGPAINLAEKGFYVNSDLAKSIKLYLGNTTVSGPLREILIKADGSFVQEGDLLKLPLLANTLRILSREGHVIFYNGSLAQDVLAELGQAGSIITQEDMDTYESQWWEPLKVSLQNGNWTIFTPPPPSLGFINLHILQILDGFDLSSTSLSDPDQAVLTYHVISEAFGFAVAALSNIRREGNTSSMVLKLTSALHAASIRQLIKLNSTYDRTYGQTDRLSRNPHGGTSLSVITPDGAAVSVTNSLNQIFGSGHMGNTSGILFNSGILDYTSTDDYGQFTLVPPNQAFSPLCPSILFQGSQNNLKLIIGASGGSRIPLATAFVTSQNIWLDKLLPESVSKYRLNQEENVKTVLYEHGIDESILNGLRSLGHDLLEDNDQGSVNAIRNDCAECSGCMNCIHAVCDRRKAGEPDGL